MNYKKAKKSLGQHFLTSKTAVSDIIRAADVSSSDVVLEIGPGKGFLTEALLARARRVVAVEKDDSLITHLTSRFEKEIREGRLSLIRGDILSLDHKALGLPETFKLVANIPYYITGALLRQCLETGVQPLSLTLLLQKEVVDRIIARDGKESILSISVKVYGIPKRVAKVPKRYFSPPPKVDSAILTVTNISKKFFEDTNEKKFFAILHAGFQHKRKLLIRNLETLYEKGVLRSAFETCSIDIKARAENLTREQWGCIVQYLRT